MITVTDKAREKIKEISDSEGIGHYCVRAKILGGGCAGYRHDLYFDDIINESDEVTTISDIKVIVDELSYTYIENVTIDYVEDVMSEGFRFTSPNIKSSCGCGSSVSY